MTKPLVTSFHRLIAVSDIKSYIRDLNKIPETHFILSIYEHFQTHAGRFSYRKEQQALGGMVAISVLVRFIQKIEQEHDKLENADTKYNDLICGHYEQFKQLIIDINSFPCSEYKFENILKRLKYFEIHLNKCFEQRSSISSEARGINQKTSVSSAIIKKDLPQST